MKNTTLNTQLLVSLSAVFLLAQTSLLAEDTEDSSVEGDFAVSYVGVPDDEQTIVGLSLNVDVTEQTKISLSSSKIEAEADPDAINTQLSDISASSIDIGFEHWLSNKKVGFGLEYSSWDNGDQLKNNDLTASFLYQLDYWIFGLDATTRTLENSAAIFGDQTTTDTENTGLGLGFSAIYVGIENAYLSFGYTQFDYDSEILTETEIQTTNDTTTGPGSIGFIPPSAGVIANSVGVVPVDTLQYVENFPLGETSTSLGMGYFFKNDSILGFDIAFNSSLFDQSDSTSYGVSYSRSLTENLEASLGASIYDQGTIKSEIYNLGLTWNF